MKIKREGRSYDTDLIMLLHTYYENTLKTCTQNLQRNIYSTN